MACVASNRRKYLKEKPVFWHGKVVTSLSVKLPDGMFRWSLELVHRVPKCDVIENEICEIMGFVKIFWKSNVQDAYSPKISNLGLIVSEILAQLCSDDSIQILLNHSEARVGQSPMIDRAYVRVYRLYGSGRGDYQKEGRGGSGVSWQVHIFNLGH